MPLELNRNALQAETTPKVYLDMERMEIHEQERLYAFLGDLIMDHYVTEEEQMAMIRKEQEQEERRKEI